MLSRRSYRTWLALSLLLALGAWVRLVEIAEMSISHPEMYVPGIPLPEGLSIPAPHLDLLKAIGSTLKWDTHPPGYYVMMWFVTKCFGSGIWALRLPSVLLGTASIGLIFWLGTLVGKRSAGWIAALLLTFNGYHIFWSRIARMYSLECFLGLLSTVLLLLLARETGSRRKLEVLYALSVLAGLVSHVVFWPLFATHILWILVNAWTSRRAFPQLLSIQVLVLILASPLLAVAAYQSGNPVATLSSDILLQGKGFAQFAFLFPPEGQADAFSLSPTESGISIAHVPILETSLLIGSLLLLLVGFSSVERSDERLARHSSGPSKGVWLAAAGLATMVSLGYVVAAELYFNRPLPSLQYAKAMTPLPVLIALTAVLFDKGWNRLSELSQFLAGNRFVVGSQALLVMLALVPFILMSLFSILVTPILSQRALLFIGPYLLFVLAAGIASLGRNRLVAVVLFLAIGLLHTGSVLSYHGRAASPIDYRRLAQEFRPYAENSDLVFLRRAWYATPILYYLPADQYNLAVKDFSEVCRRNPDSRVWRLLFRGEDTPTDMQRALESYQLIRKIEIYNALALLYSPKRPPGRSAGDRP